MDPSLRIGCAHHPSFDVLGEICQFQALIRFHFGPNLRRKAAVPISDVKTTETHRFPVGLGPHDAHKACIVGKTLGDGRWAKVLEWYHAPKIVAHLIVSATRCRSTKAADATVGKCDAEPVIANLLDISNCFAMGDNETCVTSPCQSCANGLVYSI